MARLGKRFRPREYPRPAPGEAFPILAPAMGMNTRDSVSALQPLEARLIENMYSDGGKLIIRKGKAAHQTIAGADSCGTMWTHEGVADDVLLAAAGGEIWDVTGAPSALTAATYMLNNWCIEQFNDTTIAVNGTDTPWAFDGSTVVATGFSGAGLTIANLRTIKLVGSRLWFTEEGSADVWYGGLNAITGVLTKFQLSQETRGGYCVGIYPYRTYTVFIMSTGEVVTYSGDPATTFALADNSDSPRPVGYDPGLLVGNDLIIMTEISVIPYEAIAAGLAFETSAFASWSKISKSWEVDFNTYGALTQWTTLYAKGFAIFSIPTDTGTSKQWVYNTKSKGWAFYTNLNAFNFAELDGDLYFGDRGAGEVYTNTGGTDLGAPIIAELRGAFVYPYGNKVNGQYTLARLNLNSSGSVTAQLQVDVDYVTSGMTAPEVAISSSGSGPWDGPWDGPWGEDGVPVLLWHKIRGLGKAVAPAIKFHSSADVLELFATDILAAPAGVL